MNQLFGLNKRFGMVAVEKGYVSRNQISEALATQVAGNLDSGVHRRIGAILFDEGLITPSQIHDVLSSITSSAKLAT